MIPSTLITTYLQMGTRAEFCPRYVNDPSLSLQQMQIPLVGYYRFLYQAVGEQWRWRDRLTWSDDHLADWLARPTTEVHVLYTSGTPAGYVELDRQTDEVEIAYFGLIPQFFGWGYGKHLLSYGVQRAWERGTKRVWVHTCNLDGEYAIPTYEKCGFRVYDVQEEPMSAKYLT